MRHARFLSLAPVVCLTAHFFMFGASAAQGATPIETKYLLLGGSGGFLGNPTIAESTTPDGIGSYRHYQGGSIYWHPETNAHEVHGLIRQKWSELGWEKSFLGYPMTDEISTFDDAGKVTKFQGGELIWRKATNQVSVVKSTDLVIDWPFPVAEAWEVLQANSRMDKGGSIGWPCGTLAEPNKRCFDSHVGPWAYCWDMKLAGKDQSESNGRPFTAVADGKIVHVDEGAGSGGASNIIVQALGEGRYASYLHIFKGSYSKRFAPDGDGLNFSPQVLPWENRPTAKSGAILGEVSDTGANEGAFHLHFSVTTKPDREGFKPFESTPVAFRNYSYSEDNGKTWTYVSTGVPKRGQWVRREKSKGQTAPEVNASATVLNNGTVKGTISLAPNGGKPTGAGKLRVTVSSEWGEPLKSTTVNVPTNNLIGPWTYEIKNVTAYDDLNVAATYNGPWSDATAGPIAAESGPFALAPNGTATRNLQLKALIIR